MRKTSTKSFSLSPSNHKSAFDFLATKRLPRLFLCLFFKSQEEFLIFSFLLTLYRTSLPSASTQNRKFLSVLASGTTQNWLFLYLLLFYSLIYCLKNSVILSRPELLLSSILHQNWENSEANFQSEIPFRILEISPRRRNGFLIKFSYNIKSFSLSYLFILFSIIKILILLSNWLEFWIEKLSKILFLIVKNILSQNILGEE